MSAVDGREVMAACTSSFLDLILCLGGGLVLFLGLCVEETDVYEKDPRDYVIAR